MEEVHAQADLMSHAEAQGPRGGPGQCLQEPGHRALGHELHHQPTLQREPGLPQAALVQAEDLHDVRAPSLEHQGCLSLDRGRGPAQRDQDNKRERKNFKNDSSHTFDFSSHIFDFFSQKI